MNADLKLELRNKATADAIRAAGIPDAFNRFLPENAHLNRSPEPMKTPGAKAAQLRAFREADAPKTKPTVTPAVTTESPAKPGGSTTEKESTMRKTATTTKAKARTSVKGKTKAKATEGKTKVQIVADLLKRPGGCTTKDVLAATGWPAVSMPQQAKAAGLKLKKVKDEGVTRYSAA